MSSYGRFVSFFIVLVGTAIAVPAAERWNKIVVDLTKGSVLPSDPVVNTASGTDVAVILVENDNPALLSRALFRFPRTVYEMKGKNLEPINVDAGVIVRGSTLSLNFQKCRGVMRFANDSADSAVNCPIIVVRRIHAQTNASSSATEMEASSVVTVYSDNDGIELFGETTDESSKSVKRVPVFIGVVQRRAGLSWSAGLSFFSQTDEKWGLVPVPFSVNRQTLTRLPDASAGYRVAASANYMGILGPPQFGISFGVATDVPFESLATTLGITFTIRTLPLADSANLTAGVAYAPHQVLVSEYRPYIGEEIPVGVAASSLTAAQHDLGWFVGISFNFAGGEDQFKTVFSGGGHKEEADSKP
jgi:hypothetical protein